MPLCATFPALGFLAFLAGAFEVGPEVFLCLAFIAIAVKAQTALFALLLFKFAIFFNGFGLVLGFCVALLSTLFRSLFRIFVRSLVSAFLRVSLGALVSALVSFLVISCQLS